MTPSVAMLWSSPSSTAETAQLCVGLLAAPLLLPASSSSSSSPALAPSVAASEAVGAGAAKAAASAAAFAKATTSRPGAVEVTTGAGEDAATAAEGSVTAAAAAEWEPLIEGAEPYGVASIAGELGALDAMEQDEELEVGARRFGEGALGFANGE